jgi:hypothetical protein
MRHQPFFNWVLSLLLIGLGFLLGHYHALHNGFLPQGGAFLTASGLLPMRAEVGDYTPLLITAITEEISLKPEAEERLLFPARVGDLQMNKLISGEEAMTHAQKIHGDNAPLARVFIPYYSSKDEQVTVWIFEMASVQNAKMHMEIINERMTETQSENSFSTFSLQDVEVYYLQSGNTNNYYYRKDNVIYWISMVTSNPAPLFLRFYEYF